MSKSEVVSSKNEKPVVLPSLSDYVLNPATGKWSLASFSVPKVSYTHASIVDKSNYHPGISILNSLHQGSTRNFEYDFPDGKDTGMRLGVVGSLGADISELEEQERILKLSVDSDKEKLKDFIDSEEQSLENPPTSSPNPSSSDSSTT